MIWLNITPKSCLQDEKVVIQISGLKPDFHYTLTSHIQDTRNRKYFTYAHYISDHHGVINTSQHESFGGHYKGIFQMGFVAALQPELNEDKFLRFFKRDVKNPNKIEIKLFQEFKTSEEIFSSMDSYIASNFHYRYFMSSGVTRVPIRQGSVRATLFIPPGEGPFPGVIDMFGTAGGLLEYRSAQFASRGIVSLALAFFDYDDLPKAIIEYDLDYFREAVQVLLSHNKVKKPYVAAVGVSKGADLALSMAAFIPEVIAAVSINGCISNLGAPMKIKEGYVIPTLGMDTGRGMIVDEIMFVNRDTDDDPEDNPETIILIHKSSAKYLFIVGEDDKSLNSLHYASVASKFMRNAKKGQNIKVCSYKGTGHLLEPPYSPLCAASFHKVFGCVMAWGGELKAHTEAQEKSWIEMINFIKSNLDMKTSKL